MSSAPVWNLFKTRPGAEMLTDDSILAAFFDVGQLEEFWLRWYLRGFIEEGYGKVKFLLGSEGSGKTHLLRHLALTAASLQYLAVIIDARRIRLADIEELYRAIATSLPLADIVERACHAVIAEHLGYPEFEGAAAEFAPWAERVRGLDSVLLRRDIREAVDRFLHPLDLSNDVLLALRSWLNLRIIDDPDPGTAYSFLLGRKLSAAERKSLGVYANLNRRNARTALSSLFVFCHAAGFRGVVTLIDHLETMANTARIEGDLYYTRGKRDQSYEMLRQIIDESVHTPYFMLVLAGSSDPLGDTRVGFPSYPALWARIQNEISTDQVNRFADVIAMDTLWHNDSESTEHLAKIWLSHQPHLDETIAPYRSPDAVGLEWALARRVVLAALSARDTPLEEV